MFITLSYHCSLCSAAVIEHSTLIHYLVLPRWYCLRHNFSTVFMHLVLLEKKRKTNSSKKPALYVILSLKGYSFCKCLSRLLASVYAP